MTNYTDIDNIIDLTPSALRRFINDPQTHEEERVAMWLETKADSETLDSIGYEVCTHVWEVWQVLTEAIVKVSKQMMEEEGK